MNQPTPILHLLAAIAAVVFAIGVTGCMPEVQYCEPGDPGYPNCGSSACPGGCPSGQYCASGQCISNAGQCAQVGEACNPQVATSEGFLCIDWDGQGVREPMCSEFCAADGSCPAGSSCFVLNSVFDVACESASECRDGMQCIQGTCRYTACQPSECSGFVSGQQACAQKYADHPSFPDGAKCYEFPNQSNYCFPAGTRALGESCDTIQTAMQTQDFQSTCAPGLGCVSGTCRTACESDADCSGDNTCTFSEATALGDGVGFCANPCTPFEEGACGEDKMCQPVSADSGQCVPTGSTPAFSRCTPGEHQCEPGTLCVEYPGANGQNEARCHPICDLTAAPPGADGSVSDSAQAARDATCPQPPAALAALRVVHMAETLGPVDVYLLGRDEPIVEGLNFETAHPAAADSPWVELEPGRYQIIAVPAGAPRTDRPLASTTVDMVSGVGKTVYVAPPDPANSDDAQPVVVEALPATERGPDTELRVIHLLSDIESVDVIAVSATAEPADTANHYLLAEGLTFGEASRLAAVPAGELRVLVFPKTADRADPSQAVLDATGIAPTMDSALLLRGTIDPDDFYRAEQPTVMPLVDPAASSSRGMKMSCTALSNGAYGYCQQVCSGGPADFGQGVCDGEAMGCTATDFPTRAEWLTLCAPVGDGGSDTPCNPARPYGQCQEGFFCMQYGTGASAGADGLTGRCTPLCAVDGAGTSALGCDAGQSCKPVVYDGSYDVGQCGWECTPGEDYADPSCPAGLQSCKPTAALREDTSGQTAPLVTDEQPFCSPSGPLPAGETCRGRDCVGGTECIYPRSEQTDLVSTLLSPYFGASGQIPTCTPQCDPFDGDDAATQCAPGETCLPNYPWSAEVGHCAPIEEEVHPMQPCTKPGLSCGEDSVCVIYQGGQQCFRLCDYEGADAQGAYEQSTCPSDMACEPFVADIGLCALR